MKRRYKVLCDNIFLHATEDPLRKSNMNKLLFYSISHAEKLDRIGKYLLSLQRKNVSRNKKNLVAIGVETFDQLMTSRGGHTGLIIDSYLKMLHVLLEMKELCFFEIVVESFWRFSQIKDDASAYSGNLDFLVDRFCAFSFVGVKSEDDFTRYRLASLKGIKGLICKAVNDKLQLSIYSSEYISQIIPVIFFNLFPQKLDNSFPKRITISEQAHLIVRGEAEDCLRDLVSRATYNSSVSNIVQIVLTEYDTHFLWTLDSPLPIKYFKLIICSFPVAHTDVVVTHTLNHLTKHELSDTEIRIGICKVLKGIIEVLSKNYMSESILEFISRLLHHTSRSLSEPQNNHEKEYQGILSQIMVNFARNLSSCQRVEVMDYIISKLPYGDNTNRHVLLLLQTVKEISRDSEPGLSVHSQFPSSSFLDNLMGLSLSNDAEIRLEVQVILQCLFDRRDIGAQLPPFRNAVKFDYSSSSLSKSKVAETDRLDGVFMGKHGMTFFVHLNANTALVNNSLSHFEQLFRTIVLIDYYFPSSLIDIIRLLIRIQNVECDERPPFAIICQIHALIAAVFVFVARNRDHSRLTEYVDDVIHMRNKHVPYYLPEWFYLNESPTEICEDFSSFLFDSDKIGMALDGIDRRDELLQPFSFEICQHAQNFDVLDTQSGSLDIALINVSIDDTPDIIKFDTFKKIKEKTQEVHQAKTPFVDEKLLLRPINDNKLTGPLTIPTDMSDIYIEMK